MNTEHKYKTVMTVMNKLMNTLQAKNPDCLQELQSSTAVLPPAAKEPPTAKNLQQSHAIVASRFGGGVLSITGGEGVNVVEPPTKRAKVMSCTLCKALGDDATNHSRAGCTNCPNFCVKKETISIPMKLTPEQCTETSIRYPIAYWPNTNYSDTDFPIPSGAEAGEEWVAVMPKRKLHKAKQIPKELKPW